MNAKEALKLAKEIKQKHNEIELGSPDNYVNSFYELVNKGKELADFILNLDEEQCRVLLYTQRNPVHLSESDVAWAQEMASTL